MHMYFHTKGSSVLTGLWLFGVWSMGLVKGRGRELGRTSTGTERYKRCAILDELRSRVPSLRDEFVGTGEACLYYSTRQQQQEYR